MTQTLALLQRLVWHALLASAARWATLDLTLPHLVVLLALASPRQQLPAALARRLGLELAALRTILRQLEQRGLATRWRATQDRPRVQVALTPAGQQLVQELCGQGVRGWQQQVAMLPPERQQALAEGLHGLLTVLGPGDTPHAPEPCG